MTTLGRLPSVMGLPESPGSWTGVFCSDSQTIFHFRGLLGSSPLDFLRYPIIDRPRPGVKGLGPDRFVFNIAAPAQTWCSGSGCGWREGWGRIGKQGIPRTKQHQRKEAVIMDKSQAYFWTKKWQEREREADEDIKAGRVKAFDSVEELGEDLG